MKDTTFSLTSLNDNGYGFKINITFHSSHKGHCDFDLVWMAENEETDNYVGVLMEHDDIERLQSLLSQAWNESSKRLPEEDSDDEMEFDFFGEED